MTTETLRTWLPEEKLRGYPSKQAATYPSGRMWPHGEWSLGWGKRRPDGGEWHEDPFVGMGVDDVGVGERSAAGREPLNLSDAPNSHKRPRRGLNGISGYGQQMIKACGFLMGERWPRHRKTLGTITLPPMLPEVRRTVVEVWPELTRQLLQRLARQLGKRSLPKVVCSVTEVQPKRLVESGEAYLHWHLLWLNQPGKKGNWAVDPVDLSAWVSDLLYRTVPGYTGGHINVNVKPVKGEAARYLAKYMSKGKQQVAEALTDWGEDNCPRTWWNMTKPARDMVRVESPKGEAVGALLETLLGYAWEIGPDEMCDYLRHIEVEFDGIAVTMGWRGRFVPEIRDWARAVLNSAHMG